MRPDARTAFLVPGPALTVLLALCAWPGMARAQTPATAAGTATEVADTPPESPPVDATAAAPTPPRPYPPPPPRWANQQPPIDYPFPQAPATQAMAAQAAPPPAAAAQSGPVFPYVPPPPAPDGVSRRFSFTAAIGPGALIGPGEKALALSYQVARAGLGLDPDLILQLSYEGLGTSSVNPMTKEDSWLKQDVFAAGLQHFLGQRAYVRGAVGVGFVSEKTPTMKFSGGRGIAALAAFGYELMQRPHWSMGLDLHAGLTHYPDESWKTLGVDVTVSIF